MSALIRCVAIGTSLLLSGCLEAIDLAEERLVSPPYCERPDGIALCEPDTIDGGKLLGSGPRKP